MRYRLKQVILSIVGMVFAIITVAPPRGLDTATTIETMIGKSLVLLLTLVCFRAASNAGKKCTSLPIQTEKMRVSF